MAWREIASANRAAGRNSKQREKNSKRTSRERDTSNEVIHGTFLKSFDKSETIA
jgi:hypothetical protein